MFRCSVLEFRLQWSVVGPFSSLMRKAIGKQEKTERPSHIVQARHTPSQWDPVFCKWLKIRTCGSRTCKPNSVRRIVPAGRPFLWAAHRCAALATYPKVGRTEPARARNPIAQAADSLPIWSCSVWGLPCPRHCCRGGALLPHLFTLTPPVKARRYVFCGTFRRADLNPPSRTLSGTLLCGVRTFLSPRRSAGSGRPVRLPTS